MTKDIQPAVAWFASQGWTPAAFQLDAWKAFLDDKSGIVNAPTGSGKTYSLFVPVVLDHIRKHPKNWRKPTKGLKCIWISPIRALTKEIQQACQRCADGMGLSWQVAIRSGDTSSADRQKHLKSPPQVLITTPESLHVILSNNGYKAFFEDIECIVADEWHELMGSKRGVMTELFISKMRSLNGQLRIWGISATIANLREAIAVLLGDLYDEQSCVLIKSEKKKRIAVESIIPDEIEKYPWAGHLGIKLLSQVVPIIHRSKTTLIFTNTRAQCEIWYQKLLEEEPDLAGIIAMHHGSISRELRTWVEDGLYAGSLKAVVCTSSLDLGVDFRPVETIIQIGSPKGVARFMQRAGRSGHSPGAISKIFFVPTHALELVEGAALRSAIDEQIIEGRQPYIRSFDVLIQYMMTLACSGGFYPNKLFDEVTKTHCFESIDRDEYDWCLGFLINGGQTLEAYDEYQKVGKAPDGRIMVLNKKVAVMHKLSIGTISSTTSMNVHYVSGKKLGTVEEWFISNLNPGDAFWFSGRVLELVRVKGMIAQVRKSKKKTARTPSWLGGRVPLSSMLAAMLRRKLHNYVDGQIDEIELEVLIPLFNKQASVSILPKRDELLIEYYESKEGWHLCFFPFEGRAVHEGMGALLAKRISELLPISFSIAMNDYGLELLSDQEIDLESILTQSLFDTDNLWLDIQSSMNSVEMARRKFRDIARISGLVFQGYPGQAKKTKHLQMSSSLIFDVFKDYDASNLLLQQTYEEVLSFELEETRLRKALERMQKLHYVVSRPGRYTPFSFPMIVDRLREKLSSERIEDRVKRLVAQMEG